MSAYGYGDSTPGSVRASIAAAVVFDTLGRCDVPERKKWAQLGESAFLDLWYAHEKGEFRCADGKAWKALGRFGFTEEIAGLADERRTAAAILYITLLGISLFGLRNYLTGTESSDVPIDGEMYRRLGATL